MKWQYTNGVKDASLVSPDTWTMDQTFLDRPGNAEIQLDLFYDYRTNLPLYPQWQTYFREHKPATLVVWGKNDAIFVQPVPLPTSETFRMQRCTCSIPGTSPWRRTATRSRS